MICNAMCGRSRVMITVRVPRLFTSVVRPFGGVRSSNGKSTHETILQVSASQVNSPWQTVLKYRILHAEEHLPDIFDFRHIDTVDIEVVVIRA